MNPSSKISAEARLPTEADFWEFVATVPLASRDTGFGVIEPWGTQRVLIREIFEGLQRGIRQFLVLKAGQVGASSILLLLTQFWYRHSPGLQGVMVADSDELREFFRDQFGLTAKHTAGFEEPRMNNKNQIAWENGSRLLFQTSGIRTGNRLGVGRGVAYVWGSEVGLWQNPASLTYLRTRFSDKHPHRLAVYEGTARGKNWWFDLWTEAEEATEIHRIFLAWWLREDYRVEKDSAIFKQYWDGRFTMKERQWAYELTRRYKVTLDPEQWAWRRWYLHEKAGGDHRLADQEMPTLPADAFDATGESFLGHELIKRIQRSIKHAGKPKSYRYEFGSYLEESVVNPTTQAMGELFVWEEPVAHEAYVISAVPAHSATPDCHMSVVSVWKASRDHLEQVAEFASDRVGLQTFSWVCVHLLSVYQVPRRSFILEVAGTGGAILQELKRLQHSGWGTHRHGAIRQIVGPIQHYLWRRPDSATGTIALQWKSDGNMQTWVIRRLKDQLETGAVKLRSTEALVECERMRQVGAEFVSDSRTAQEHRMMAAALAVESWASQLRPLFRKVQGPMASQTVMGRLVSGFFNQLRISEKGA